MSESSVIICRRCGIENPQSSNYCNSCGARIYDPEKLLTERKISFRLAMYSALSTFIFVLAISFLTAFVYTIFDQDILSKPENLIYISIIGPSIGIFLSTIFTTYIFADMRIKDSFIGASVIMILFKIIDFVLASDFTIEGIGVALLSCLIAFAGAWLGFRAKKKIKFKN